MSAPACPLDACRDCTGCAHNRPPCRLTVRCPTTGEVHPCRHAPEETP